MPPLIAITAGEITDHAYPWAPVAYGKAHTYTDAVLSSGGVPVLVPLIDDIKLLRRLYDACDGLLLSGGNDLDPTTYNAETSPHTSDTSPRRDKQEVQMLKWALEDDKPVLGICRGMQIINVTLGGTLYQHISDDLHESHSHQESAVREDFNHLAHKLRIEDSSQLANIMGTTTVDTNGLHHQAVCELGDGLIASAHAEDDVIEAIELPNKRFVIGVQSHPEALESKTEPLWRKLFTAFVRSCQST